MANPTLLLAGLAMAFVASAETLLSAAAVDRMHNGPRTNYDRELAAQGVGNLICGFLGSLPMTGVIVRSSANVQAGAKTRLSTILHGAWMLAFVMLIPGVLRMIPTASLAGILVFTGWKLIDKKAFRQVASYGRMPIVIYAATVIGIVSTDLLTGVLIGISLSVAKVLYKVASVRLEMDHDPVRNRADLRLHGAATFLKIPALAQALEKLPAGCEVHLHFDRLVYIDHACIDLLTRWQEQAASQGGQLIVEWEGLIARNARLGEA
jgi:MFS superfamily sulfate permease-like transporter